MPSLANVFTSVTCLVAVATALPSSQARTAAVDDSEAVCSTSSADHLASTIYDIFPEHADLAKDPVSGVHLETYNDASQVEQVVVFTGIPAGAKNCQFNWKQADRISRTFVVKGSEGLAGVRQLSGLPNDEEGVSFNSIKPFNDADADIGGADFTFWDESSTAAAHSVGSTDCAETLYFKVGLRNSKGNTSIFLAQDDGNGYYLSYSC